MLPAVTPTKTGMYVRQHDMLLQAGGASWLLGAPDRPAHQAPPCNSGSLRLACSQQPGFLLEGAESSAEQQEREQRAHHADADAFAAAAYCRTLEQHLCISRLFPPALAPTPGLLVATWAQKLPQTWRFIEAVMRGQVPTLLPGQRGAVAAGIQVSIQLQLERWRQHQGARQQSHRSGQLS